MVVRGFAAAIAAIAAMAVLSVCQSAMAFDDAQYPDLRGQWSAIRFPGVKGQGSFDPTKDWGFGQQAPLTPEYEKVLEASIADLERGGQGGWMTGACLPPGMPAMMTLYRPMEIVVKPEITYLLIDHAINNHRRIYTDGRDWPKEIEPSFLGYSIGRWMDPANSGHFSVLEVETRGFKGPRAIDTSGLPTHVDNQTVVFERFYLDKTNPAVLHNEMTIMDHALTRPWSVAKIYRRSGAQYPDWAEDNCGDNNPLVHIHGEYYYKGADGHMMPTRKGQPPPDLRYFKERQK